MPVNNTIAIKIHRKGNGTYCIHSITGSVRLSLRMSPMRGHKDEQREFKDLRVGDEVTEEQIEYLTMHSRTYKVTIVRGN